MIEKKSLVMAIKRALESGGFNYVGQEATQIPPQLWNIDDLQIEDQNWWECNPILKVDVSNNQITAIPDGLTNLKDLQLLRMKNNLVVEIPVSLMSLSNLKSIDLSRNKLQRIPVEISQGNALVELNFSENLLQFCPDLHTLTSLENLLISDNKLKVLPCLGPNIKKVEASNNKLIQIRREQFYRCENLEHLNLGKNLIQRVEPKSFVNARNLVSLEMKENRLLQFKEVPQSNRLDMLSLAYNRLTQFSSYGQGPNLTVLILADNKIRKLSKEIIQLQKLKTLDISNNDLSELPCQIGFINSLVRMQVQGNPLKTIRQSIRTGGTNMIKQYLREKMDPKQKAQLEQKTATSFQKVSDGEHWNKLLYQFTQNGQLILRQMNINQLDELVFEKQLRGINISQNKIKNISKNIVRINTLQYLIVNNNEIEELPATLSQLPCLEQIEAKHNKLTNFDSCYQANYPRLHYLDLSTNRLTMVPKAILQIRHLRTLHLAYNCISEVQCLWNSDILFQLEVLDISNNKIVEISDRVYGRVALNYLNLQNNGLSKIPTIIGWMKLSGLKIDGNPLKLIKRTVIDKGTVAIMQYLRNKHAGDPPEPQKPISKPKQPQYIPEKPTYPYETQPIKVLPQKKQPTQPQQPQEPTISMAERNAKIKQLERQIKKLQDEIDNNMSMNTMQKNQKKKAMQALMIERNKLLKE